MSNQVITFEIITPQSHKKIEVEWIEIESPSGSFVIGPNHLPLVSLVSRKGRLSFKLSDQSVESIYPSHGIFLVNNNYARAIVDI